MSVLIFCWNIPRCLHAKGRSPQALIISPHLKLPSSCAITESSAVYLPAWAPGQSPRNSARLSALIVDCDWSSHLPFLRLLCLGFHPTFLEVSPGGEPKRTSTERKLNIVRFSYQCGAPSRTKHQPAVTSRPAFFPTSVVLFAFVLTHHRRSPKPATGRMCPSVMASSGRYQGSYLSKLTAILWAIPFSAKRDSSIFCWYLKAIWTQGLTIRFMLTLPDFVAVLRDQANMWGGGRGGGGGGRERGEGGRGGRGEGGGREGFVRKIPSNVTVASVRGAYAGLAAHGSQSR